MDALLERDEMVVRRAAEVAGRAVDTAASRGPAAGEPGASQRPRRATMPARLAPQTAAPMRAPAPAATGEDPVVRATRALAANMMVGPRMAMAMAAMTPYPFAWNPPLWYTALSWPATARAAALAFAATHPLVAAPVLAALAERPAGRRIEG